MNKKLLIVVAECLLVFVALPLLGVRLWTRHVQKIVANGDALMAVEPEKALRCYSAANAFYPGGFDAASNRLAFCKACAIGSSDEPNTNAFDGAMYAFLTNDVAFCKALSRLPKQSDKIEIAMLYRTNMRTVLSDVLWERLNRLGNDGDLFAQKELAMCYAFGSGCKLDVKQFFQWLKKAADQGDAESCALMGTTQIRLRENRDWSACLVSAIYDGYYPHFGDKAWHLGDIIKIREIESFDVDSILAYGERYGLGPLWVEKALDKGIRIPLGSRGRASAQISLVEAYWPGESKEQSLRVAKLLHEMDYGGSSEGPFLLGWLYELGLGVDKDSVKAFNCFKMASEKWYPFKRKGDEFGHLNKLSDHLILGVELASRYARVWDPRSLWILGVCYENGYGVDKADKGVALSWYQKAVDNGFAYAQKDVDRLKRDGVSAATAE